MLVLSEQLQRYAQGCLKSANSESYHLSFADSTDRSRDYSTLVPSNASRLVPMYYVFIYSSNWPAMARTYDHPTRTTTGLLTTWTPSLHVYEPARYFLFRRRLLFPVASIFIVKLFFSPVRAKARIVGETFTEKPVGSTTATL